MSSPEARSADYGHEPTLVCTSATRTGTLLSPQPQALAQALAIHIPSFQLTISCDFWQLSSCYNFFPSLALFRVHVLFSRSLQALTRICTTCSLPCPLADRTDRQRPASLLFNHLSSAAAHISTRDTRCQVWVCQIESQAESVYAIMASSKVLSRPALIVPVSKAC